jgi:hypothetical protein
MACWNSCFYADCDFQAINLPDLNDNISLETLPH